MRGEYVPYVNSCGGPTSSVELTMRPSSPSHSRNGEHTSSHQPPAAAVLTNEAHLRSFLAFSVSHLTTRRVPGRRSRWCASVSAVVVVREGRKRGGNERTVDLSPSRPTRTRTLAPPARQDDEPVAPNSASRETERQPTQKPSMPPTDAAPPSPDHPKSSSNDDDDDDEGSPVVEAPVSLEQRQPGAFSILGPDGRRRRNSSTSRSDDEASQKMGDGDQPGHSRRRTVLRTDDEKSTVVLVPVANLVTTSDADDVPLVEGEAMIVKTAAERKRSQRRRLIRFLGLVLVVAAITAGIAVGMTMGINSNQNPASLSYHAPTVSPVYESLPQHSTTLLYNTISPQYLARNWLTSNDDNLNLDVWKLRQRFALACFRFTTNAFDSYVADQFSPLDVDECQWDGVSCNQRGNVT